MCDLWSEMNDKVPLYLDSTIKKYHLKCVKIGSTETVLIGKKFALFIAMGRFRADISYVMRDNKSNLIRYLCDSFFSKQFDDNDRKGLLEGKGAKVLIANDLIILNNGLKNKLDHVLRGDTSWLEQYKKSKWFGTIRLMEHEIKILEKYL